MTEVNQNETTPLNAQIDGIGLEALRLVAQWHEAGVTNINTMLDNTKAGVILNMGDQAAPTQVVLTEEMAKGFKIGLILALSMLGELPFKLEPTDAGLPGDALPVIDAEFEEVPPNV